VGCRNADADSCASLAAATGAQPTAVVRQPAAFRIACFLADSDQACTTWGTALVDGAIARDGPAARRALEKACQETSGGRACAALGLGFEAGHVGERDRTLAARYYGWACAQDEFEACERRGDLLMGAVGVRRDDAVALASFTRACTGGRPTGCFKAGRVLDLGTDIDRDWARALEFYRTGCNGGVADACYGLGRMVEEGSDDVAPDFASAREAYDKAVTGGNLEARAALARLYWQGLGGPRKKARAKELATEACQRGDRRACQGPSFL
jgi:TPR repeat protein